MSRKPDQLDMALRREVITIRRNFTDARLRIRKWEPRPCPQEPSARRQGDA